MAPLRACRWLRPGDQFRGRSQRQARAVLQRIAAEHAAYWMDPVLKAHPWLPSHTYWFQGQFDDLIEAFKADYGLRIGERTVALVRQVVERSDGPGPSCMAICGPTTCSSGSLAIVMRPRSSTGRR